MNEIGKKPVAIDTTNAMTVFAIFEGEAPSKADFPSVENQKNFIETPEVVNAGDVLDKVEKPVKKKAAKKKKTKKKASKK